MTDRILYASDIIDSHIRTLRALLTDGINLATTACEHLQRDERLAAVGTILPIQDLLAHATAIHAVILLLNRQRG